MPVIKTSLAEVMNDDPNSPFWKKMSSTSAFKLFEKELDNIIAVSLKYNKLYNDLTAEELKNERP